MRGISLGGVPKPEPEPKSVITKTAWVNDSGVGTDGTTVSKRKTGSGILDVLTRAAQVAYEQEPPKRGEFDPDLLPPRKELGEFIVEYHEPGSESWCIVERVYWDKQKGVRSRTRLVQDSSTLRLREVFIERIDSPRLANETAESIYQAIRAHLKEDLRRRSWDNYFNNY